MKKTSILGAALASAGLAAVIGGECFATPTGWAPSNAAIIGSNGSAIDVCLTTGAAYSGAPFVVNIKAHSAEDMNYRTQLTFDNFVDEQCKTISLPSGGFKFAIDLPAGAGDWAWNAARFNTEGVMEMWVDMGASSYFSVGNGYSSNIAATTARLKRGEDFNIALKRLAGTEAVSADDDDTNIKSITLVNEAPDSINLETSPKTLVSDGAVPIYAYMDSGKNIYIVKTAENLLASEDCSYMFKDMRSVESLRLANLLDTSNTTNMRSMFEGLSSMTKGIWARSYFDTSNVEDMGRMFAGMSSVDSVDAFFNFIVSNVKYMDYMFADMSSVTTVDLIDCNFDTANVVNMSGMFSGMTRLNVLNLPAGYFNTANVTDMSEMFAGDESLSYTGSLANFNTSKVENMSGMFYDTAIVNTNNLGTRTSGGNLVWDVSNVKDMSRMFAAARHLTDISTLGSWDVSNVENMASMFSGWTGREDKWMTLANISPLSAWDTSSVTDMNTMFRSNRVLSDISPLKRMERHGQMKWDISNVKNFNDMFMGVPNITTFEPLESWDGYIADDASTYAMFYGIPFTTARPSWYNGEGDGEL